jgi:hypothetical protein
MKKGNFVLIAITLYAVIFLSGCMAIVETVGKGGKGDCRAIGQYDLTARRTTSQYDARKKQWYLFWGLLPLNKVNASDLAKGYKNYTVRTTTSLGDYLISYYGIPFLGIQSQTIRVSLGDD